jgi:hypothetical protein
MSENAVPPAGAELLTPYLRRNFPFLGVLTLLVVLPGVVTYFGPSSVGGVTEFEWLGISWAIALILILVADEVFVPGKDNLSSGFRRPGHVSHRLVTNPRFLVGLVLLGVAPPPITYYGPVAFGSTPDWLWLILGWVVAAGAAFVMYTAMKGEEAKLA